MKGKIKTQKGLSLILIAIIAAVVILGSVGGYISYTQLRAYQAQQAEKEKQAQETMTFQQETLGKSQQEIEKLKEEVQQETIKLKQQLEEEKLKRIETEIQQRLESQKEVSPKTTTITSNELQLYLFDIGQVFCYGNNYTEGSGSLWHITGLSGLFVLTNAHVIATNNCHIFFEDPQNVGSIIGRYKLDTSNPRSWNDKTDIVLLKILYPSIDSSDPLSSLSSVISTLPSCRQLMTKGSPVSIVGYPAFSKKTIEVFGNTGTKSFQTVTEGTISAYDDSVRWPPDSLPAVNYFVSAKIDSGNSGGIAFSKNSNGLCLLGVPTWLSLGVYETQGVIQNIHNVMYEK